MKFRITMKDPDVLEDACENAAKESVKEIPGLSDSERKTIASERAGLLSEFACGWMDHGEYVVIEFDTEAGTAVLIKS